MVQRVSVLLFSAAFTALSATNCFFSSSHLTAQTQPAAKVQTLTTIAFGSCARERRKQPVWQDIIAQAPELFLMIGDNHYADFWMKDGKMVMEPVRSAERIREAYQMLGDQPGFIAMKKQCPLLATWDDHDYGANDKGNDFRLREASQKEFIRFYGFEDDHPIHKQQGIYHAKIFGSGNQRVQIILLDTRYHRDRLERKDVPGGGPYGPSTNNEKTVLGEAQWSWLQDQLSQPAEIRIIASSIQVVADEHGWETWGNFPHQRKRLYELIKKTRADGVLFISGDRHLMELSCDDGRSPGYPMWDFTSSGLTQKTEDVDEPNRHRIGPVRREQNFGMIRIDWREKPESTRINLQGYGVGGKLLTRQTIMLDSLKN